MLLLKRQEKFKYCVSQKNRRTLIFERATKQTCYLHTWKEGRMEGRKEGMGRRKKRGYIQGPTCWCQSKDLPVALPCWLYVALCELPIFLHALREMGTAGKQAAFALKKRTQTILPQRYYCVCSLMATRGVNHDAQGDEESPIRARVWSARDRIVHSNNNF